MNEPARIFEAVDGGFWLETPFSAEFVDDIKISLPKFARKWDADLRMWWVSAEFLGSARSVVLRHYELAECPALALLDTENAWKTLWLRPGAPSEVIKASYRALARLHHPDAGGDTVTMQQINLAAERLLGADDD